MSAQELASVVVGVDGSAEAEAALAWGVALAQTRGCHLQVASTVPQHDAVSPWGVWSLMADRPEKVLNAVQAQAENQLAASLAKQDRSLVGGARVRVAFGNPAGYLVELAGDSGHIVVGSRGRGWVAGMLLGSVSEAVLHHARCPVTVVRPSPAEKGPVVVGVDGSQEAQAALEAGLERARAVGAPLLVLHAWRPFGGNPWPPHDPGIVPPLTEFVAQAEQQLQTMTAIVKDVTDVEVTTVLARGSASKVLVEASATAREVIIGVRGRGNSWALGLGSTSHAVVRHSECTTTVVPRPTPRLRQTSLLSRTTSGGTPT